MEKINVSSSENIKIEINNTGFCIELNPLDLDFPLKIDETSRAMERDLEKLRAEIDLIDKKTDKMDGSFSQNTKAKLIKIRDFNKKQGQLVDELFGEGTTKAAFGDKNYFGMFYDFFDSLNPIIKKIYGNPNDIFERVKNKYKKNDSDVL